MPFTANIDELDAIIKTWTDADARRIGMYLVERVRTDERYINQLKNDIEFERLQAAHTLSTS